MSFIWRTNNPILIFPLQNKINYDLRKKKGRGGKKTKRQPNPKGKNVK